MEVQSQRSQSSGLRKLIIVLVILAVIIVLAFVAWTVLAPILFQPAVPAQPSMLHHW